MIIVEKKKRWLYFTASFSLFLSFPSWAVVNQIDFNFGRGTPMSSIQATGSSDLVGSRGTDWSADIFHLVAPRVYVGLGGGQFRSNDNVSQTFLPNAISTISSKVSSVMLLSRTDLDAGSKFVPYFIAGIGWSRSSLSVAAVPNGTWSDTGTSESRVLMDESKDSFGYAYGLGLDYLMTDRLLIGAEVRYQGSLKKDYTLTHEGSSATGLSSLQASMDRFTVGVKAGIRY